MQSQGVLTIEQMCRAGGVSRAGFDREWEQKAPDQAAMALRDAIQRASPFPRTPFPRNGKCASLENPSSTPP